MGPAIELRGVSKRYEKLSEEAILLKSVLPFTRPKRQELWALRDLQLTVAPGETIGVIGHNGAGKTTLLRILAGVTAPTEGRVRVVGRVAPLISLGVGFHPEMSGRENVLINGMLLGLTARQVQERFDQIVEFAELAEFIDTPVKFYSSGMFMRLGFAIVVHSDPSILLIDEILAVGDAAFQLKCFERLQEKRERGASIVMVSHAMHLIRQLGSRAILIRHGRVEFDGDIEQAIALHESFGGDEFSAFDGSVEILDCVCSPDGVVNYDQEVELRARIRFHRPVGDPVLAVGLRTADGGFGGFNISRPRMSWRGFAAGEEATFRIAFRARLAPGEYTVHAEVKDDTGIRALVRSDPLPLTVSGSSDVTGMVDLRAQITDGA